MTARGTATGQALYNRIERQKWWQRLALSFLLGVLAAGAMAPVHGVFLLVPAFTGLLWLIFSGPGNRNAFVCGWWFGLGYFTAGLYWISNALLVDADKFGWLAPVAVLGLAAVLALFPAFTCLLTRIFATRNSAVGRIFVFAAIWTGFEWFRGWVLTGFPWNLIGSAWVFSDSMIQSAALTGVYGLSLLSVLLAALPAVFGQGNGWPAMASPFRVIAVGGVSLMIIWGGGAIRLSGAVEETVPNVRLRLVQPNIDQKLKWKQDQRVKNFHDQIRMGAAPAQDGAPGPTHIIWSETAATHFIANNVNARKAIGHGTPPGGLTITGAPRGQTDSTSGYQVWNSLHGVDDAGEITATYDKHHLVPFGEYMPLRSIFSFAKITAGAGDFSPGPGPRTLDMKGLPPVSPLICYEVIFPGRVTDKTTHPEWMLNLTNDGWYGVSSGPYQHFAAARLRAVEEGLPLVRVANTGISGVVDGYGRVLAMLELDTRGILDSDLPRALAPTLYGRLGDWLVMVLICLVAGAGIFSKPRHRKG